MRRVSTTGQNHGTTDTILKPYSNGDSGGYAEVGGCGFFPAWRRQFVVVF
jgi:hypothetical protein